jgi:hypothetical protein
MPAFARSARRTQPWSLPTCSAFSRGLVTDRITCARLSGSAADHATCPPAADVLRLDYAVLPLINRRKAAEPTRRKDRADFMLRNKQIHSVMNHVRALEGLGGPSL